jgi:hypothetical protein
MLSPSEIQREDDFVGIAMPTSMPFVSTALAAGATVAALVNSTETSMRTVIKSIDLFFITLSPICCYGLLYWKLTLCGQKPTNV